MSRTTPEDGARNAPAHDERSATYREVLANGEYRTVFSASLLSLVGDYFAKAAITALVFVFGGVAPDDVLRGYAILLATAVGLGSVGLFFSALLRRTGASTGITYVVMLLLVIGSIFVWDFLALTSPRNSFGIAKRPHESGKAFFKVGAFPVAANVIGSNGLMPNNTLVRICDAAAPPA